MRRTIDRVLLTAHTEALRQPAKPRWSPAMRCSRRSRSAAWRRKRRFERGLITVDGPLTLAPIL